MDHLLAKLLIPFAVLLGTSALGIAVLAVGARRRPSDDAVAGAAAAPARGGGLAFNRSIVDAEDHDPHDTLVIDRRALRDSMAGLPQLRSRGAPDLRGPDAQFRGTPRREEEPPPPPPPPRRDPAARRDDARSMRESGVFDSRAERERAERERPATDRPGRDSAISEPPPGPRSASRGRDSGIIQPPPEQHPAPRGRDSGIVEPPSEQRPAPRGRESGIFDPPRRRDAEPLPPAERARPIDLTRQSSDRGAPPAPPRARPGRDLFDSGSRSRERANDAPPAAPRDRGGLFDDPRGGEPTSPPRPGARPARPDDDDLRDAPPEKTMRAQRDMFDSPSARPVSRRDTPSEPPRRTETPPQRGRGDIFDAPPRETRNLRDDDLRNPRDTRDSGRLPSRETQGLGRRESGNLEGRRIPLDRSGPGGDRRLEPVGVNIVLQQPVNPRAFVALPGKLEVIYGNFSPNDPREILLYWPVGDRAQPRFVFSKSPGETVAHIQLSHYTITPTVQADLTFENGRHTLGNLVDGDEMDRYQIRVNGVPMGLGERLVLHSGDIISMGIYRLKLIV